MEELKDTHIELLKKYTRPIIHCRSQKEDKRFGLIFGAGLNKSVGLPSWEELVRSIARDDRVRGEEIIEKTSPRTALSYKTEMLYQHFKKRCYEKACPVVSTRDFDYQTAGEWVTIVREHLYSGSKKDFREIYDGHPYLKELLPVIKDSHLTVTYNFDDYIERSIYESRTKEERRESRGYEIVTNPWVQFKRRTSIIYHPNGIVPSQAMEAPSDRFIFSESSFAEQLIGYTSGGNAGMLNHLTKNTCMFIGLSLEDETLRSILAQNAQQNPGNYHYYVMYTVGDELSEESKEAIRLTNFRVYNLITLFLDNEGISCFAELINLEEKTFLDCCQQCGIDPGFRYYVTGPLGVGKSTAINHLRNLLVYDEWLEQRLEILGKPWDELTTEEKKVADAWILNQFRLKNDRLRHKPSGIFLIDRGPLDPLAFTSPDERPIKAEFLKNCFSPRKATYTVLGGMVIFMKGIHSELALRMKITNRPGYNAAKLFKMENDLIEVYGKDNLTILDTSGLTVNEVVKKLSQIIHLENYTPIKLHETLNSHIDRGKN